MEFFFCIVPLMQMYLLRTHNGLQAGTDSQASSAVKLRGRFCTIHRHETGALSHEINGTLDVMKSGRLLSGWSLYELGNHNN
jgi:hypothetical protein